MSTIPFRERLFCSVNEALSAACIGRTKFYELANAGTIQTKKIGKKTVVVVDSLKALLPQQAA